MQQNHNPPPEVLVLTVKEVACSLKISRSMVFVLLARKSLRAIRIGRALRIPATELHRFLEEREQESLSAGDL
jgi:excisionase family DNA binding protein